MPRGPAPGWKARKPPITDDCIMAAVNQAGGLGHHHPETGEYATLVLRGFPDRDEALEWQRSLYRCAIYMATHGIADVSMSVRMSRDGKGWKLTYRVGDKTHGRRHHMETRGTDRRLWPYDPRRRNH